MQAAQGSEPQAAAAEEEAAAEDEEEEGGGGGALLAELTLDRQILNAIIAAGELSYGRTLKRSRRRR